jgi:hypothetical protein
MAMFENDPVDIVWDVDEGTIRIGPDFEVTVHEEKIVEKLVDYLFRLGVAVRYEKVG